MADDRRAQNQPCDGECCGDEEWIAGVQRRCEPEAHVNGYTGRVAESLRVRLHRDERRPAANMRQGRPQAGG